VTPSDVRALDWLEQDACRRRLRRRQRLELAAWERRAVGGPLGARHWPPLPRERRLRVLERIRRVRAVLVARSELAAALVRRIQALVPPLRPMPEHGRRCPVGCAECAAIVRWRVEYEVLSGADAVVRRYLYT